MSEATTNTTPLFRFVPITEDNFEETENTLNDLSAGGYQVAHVGNTFALMVLVPQPPQESDMQELLSHLSEARGALFSNDGTD